jgi:hypothetical protein
MGPFGMLLLTAVLGVTAIYSLDCTTIFFLKMAELLSFLCQCLLECPNGKQFSCRVFCWFAPAVLLYLQ